MIVKAIRNLREKDLKSRSTASGRQPPGSRAEEDIRGRYKGQINKEMDEKSPRDQSTVVTVNAKTK